MKKPLTLAGSLVAGILLLALFALRVVGLEPAYLDPRGEEFARSNRIARPGLWLTGEVVREEVADWDFANEVNDPVRRNTIMLETRTWYGISHSVTIGVVGRGDRLYIHAHSDEKECAYRSRMMGRDPVTVEKSPDGRERVTEVMHYWRVFQRNVPDYSRDSQGTAF